jgi:hypothetical protein
MTLKEKILIKEKPIRIPVMLTLYEISLLKDSLSAYSFLAKEMKLVENPHTNRNIIRMKNRLLKLSTQLLDMIHMKKNPASARVRIVTRSNQKLKTNLKNLKKQNERFD